jgi:hypothetical protein
LNEADLAAVYEVASTNDLPRRALMASGKLSNEVTSFSVVSHASIVAILKLFGCLVHEIF